ncbi:MAG: AEC family transporter [Coriobacteriia bacterium]
MSFIALARVLAGILALVGVGVALRATGLLKPEDAKPINTLMVYVALPALVFRTVHPAPLSWELAGIAGIAWAVTAAGFALGWVLARALRLPPRTAGGFILCAALGNTGYIGYPVVRTLLGEHALLQAIFFDVFGTVVALMTVGILVASRMGDHEGPVNPIRELLTFPGVVALIVALALKPVAVPSAVSTWLDALARLVVPLIMVSVGLSLRPGVSRGSTVPLGVIAAVRLVALPLVALAVGSAFLPDRGAVRLVVLEAGMPSMMLSLVVGMRFKLDTDFIATAIVTTSVLSIVSVPLLQMLVR